MVLHDDVKVANIVECWARTIIDYYIYVAKIVNTFQASQVSHQKA